MEYHPKTFCVSESFGNVYRIKQSEYSYVEFKFLRKVGVPTLIFDKLLLVRVFSMMLVITVMI